MHGLVWVGVLLAIIWMVLWLGFKILSGGLHLLILAAAVFIIWGLVRRGARAIGNRV